MNSMKSELSYVKTAASTTSKTAEHFVDGDPEYNFRLAVIDVFDGYLKRNPTPLEITKYSTFQNEQDILQQVIVDFPNPQVSKPQKEEKDADDVIDRSDFIRTEENYQGNESEDDVKVKAEESTYVQNAKPIEGSINVDTNAKDVLYIRKEEIQKLKQHLEEINKLVDIALKTPGSKK